MNDADRLTHLESAVMQMQYELEQLGRTVVDQQTEIAFLKRELRKFRSDFDELPAAPRDPLAEKPPHY